MRGPYSLGPCATRAHPRVASFINCIGLYAPPPGPTASDDATVTSRGLSSLLPGPPPIERTVAQGWRSPRDPPHSRGATAGKVGRCCDGVLRLQVCFPLPGCY